MKKLSLFLFSLLMIVTLITTNGFAANKGGTLNFMAPYSGDFHILDVHNCRLTQDLILSLNINRALFIWDAVEKKPLPELAEDVKISSKGMVYTIRLRNNIKFHNGRNMTVDDVIWSYERIMSLKPAVRGVKYIKVIKGADAFAKGESNSISGLKKIDKYNLKITLADPVDLTFYLFPQETAILPKEEVEKKSFATHPIGAGPFKFVKWVKGSEVVLERFEDYYKQGMPYLDKVVMKIMPEGASRDLSFRAKELDATLVGSSQYLTYKNDPNISKNMVEVAEMFTRHMGFNLNYEPLQNKKVRQAINHAINSDLIIKKYLKGKAYPAIGWLPTTSPAFDLSAVGYDYNLEKAKQLMQEAGYTDGFDLTVTTTKSKSYGSGIVEAAAPMLKKIGIRVKIELVEPAALSEKVYVKGEYQAYSSSFSTGPDPHQALSRWHSSTAHGSGNYIGYKNTEFDQLLDNALTAKTSEEKMNLLKKADSVFLNDAPIWFFNYNKAAIAYQPWVHGLRPEAVEMMFQNLENVWIDKSSPRWE